MHQPQIDVKVLARRARESEERESFEVIEQTDSVRISVGARLSEPCDHVFVIEIVVSPCSPGRPIDVSLLGSKWSLVKDLERMGYSVFSQDGGFMVGEKQLESKDLSSNLKALRVAVTNRFGPGRGD